MGVKQDVLSVVQIFDVLKSGMWWEELMEKARPACFKHSLGFLELVVSVNKPFYLMEMEIWNSTAVYSLVYFGISRKSSLF